MVHQRRFWGNTRGLSADLGGGPKQVEKTHSNRLKKYHAERRCQKVPVLRFSTLGPACHPGAFPVQAPDKASETSTWSPGSEGGRSLPGHDLAGNQIACRLVGDELAHDLDIETLQRLESLLADYLGTMLLLSRDRARQNDVSASTLVIEDDGLVKEQQASHDGDLRQRPAEPLGRGVAPC